MGKSRPERLGRRPRQEVVRIFPRTVLDPITIAPVTVVVTIVLGLKARLTKSEAREELQKEIAQQTGQTRMAGS